MSMLPFARIGAMTSCWCLLKVSKLKTSRQHKVSDSHSIHLLHPIYCVCIVLPPCTLYSANCYYHSGFLQVWFFWKNPRHKLYATSKADLKSGDSKKRALIIDSDEEEDGEPRKNQEKKPRVEEKLSLVLEELATIKDKDPTWSEACHKGNLQVPNMPPCPYGASGYCDEMLPNDFRVFNLCEHMVQWGGCTHKDMSSMQIWKWIQSDHALEKPRRIPLGCTRGGTGWGRRRYTLTLIFSNSTCMCIKY